MGDTSVPADDSSNWYAAVRYGDNKYELLQVNAIKHFHPKHLLDFNPTRVYRIKSNKWAVASARGRQYRFDALLEGLGRKYFVDSGCSASYIMQVCCQYLVCLVTAEAAEKARKAFQKSLSTEDRDRIKEIAKTLSKEPLSTSEVSASDNGQEADRREVQEERRRKALKDANFELGQRIMLRLKTTMPSVASLRSRVTDKKNSTNAKPGKRKKASEKTPEEREQFLKRKEQDTARADADKEWGETLQAVRRSRLHPENASQLAPRNLLSTSASIDRASIAATGQPNIPEKQGQPSSQEELSSSAQPALSSEKHHQLPPSHLNPVNVPSNNIVATAVQAKALTTVNNRSEEPTALRDSLSDQVELNTTSTLERPIAADEVPQDSNHQVPCCNCNCHTEMQSLQKETNSRYSEISKKLDGISRELTAALEFRGFLPNPTEIENAAVPSILNSVLCYGKVVRKEQVDLGAGYQCSLAAWKCMNTCEKLTDWCLAILRGVFGEDKAKMYRKNPRYTDLEVFPTSFLCTAEGYYIDFINRRTEELKSALTHVTDQKEKKKLQTKYDFFNGNRDELKKQLGASLSDRADTMYRSWHNKQIANGVIFPERAKRPTSGKKKKKPSKPQKKFRLLTLPKSDDDDDDDDNSGGNNPATPRPPSRVERVVEEARMPVQPAGQLIPTAAAPIPLPIEAATQVQGQNQQTSIPAAIPHQVPHCGVSQTPDRIVAAGIQPHFHHPGVSSSQLGNQFSSSIPPIDKTFQSNRFPEQGITVQNMEATVSNGRLAPSYSHADVHHSGQLNCSTDAMGGGAFQRYNPYTAPRIETRVMSPFSHPSTTSNPTNLSSHDFTNNVPLSPQYNPHRDTCSTMSSTYGHASSGSFQTSCATNPLDSAAMARIPQVPNPYQTTPQNKHSFSRVLSASNEGESPDSSDSDGNVDDLEDEVDDPPPSKRQRESNPSSSSSEDEDFLNPR